MSDDKRLSTGDAVVVVALLGFILAWVAGWWFIPDWGDALRTEEGDDGAGAVLLIIAFLIVLCPCLWAAETVDRIVRRK